MGAKQKRTAGELVRKNATTPALATDLLGDVRSLIEAARAATAQAVNSALVLLYWSIGDRIRRDILQNKRAEYGAEILPTLSAKLTEEYGKGYAEKSLRRMIQLAEIFPDRQIVAALSRQLGWTHFVEIIPIKDQLKRDFSAEMCRVERWSVRKLRDKIDGMLFERTALSKKPEKLAAQEHAQLRTEDILTPDMVFRDPHFLDFLGLKDTYSEHDLETAIVRDMESFLLELSEGFAFVARQKRMVIDGKEFVVDLLFYHRYLRRLVAIDLKLEEFKPAHKGQMELYLRWLDKHERQPDEESPLGLILCESAGAEQIELLQLDHDGIRIGTYFTELPPKHLLEQKLHTAAALARQRLQEATPAMKPRGRKTKGGGV